MPRPILSKAKVNNNINETTQYFPPLVIAINVPEKWEALPSSVRSGSNHQDAGSAVRPWHGADLKQKNGAKRPERNSTQVVPEVSLSRRESRKIINFYTFLAVGINLFTYFKLGAGLAQAV
jgi:hypothetical protein